MLACDGPRTEPGQQGVLCRDIAIAARDEVAVRECVAVRREAVGRRAGRAHDADDLVDVYGELPSLLVELLAERDGVVEHALGRKSPLVHRDLRRVAVPRAARTNALNVRL